LAFSGLYGVVPQKIELFVTTGARTSNPVKQLVTRGCGKARLVFGLNFGRDIGYPVAFVVLSSHSR
jgi:hypothetical protein